MGPAQFLVAFLYGLLEFIYGLFMIIHDKAVGIYHKETSTRMRLFEEQQARGELQLKFQTICALFDDQSTKLNDCERLNEKLKHTVKSLEEPKKLLEAQLYRLQTSLTRREGHDGVQETTINNLETTNKLFKGRVERRDRKIEELREATVKLKEQNDLLKIDNEQKRLAIVELQPIQAQHFADDAKRDYVELCDKVLEWVEELCMPISNSDVLRTQSIQYARENQGAINEFAARVSLVTDVHRGSQFEDVDEEIIAAVIMRYLWESIFSTTLCNSMPDAVDVLKRIEDSITNHIHPKPRNIEINGWRARAYHGLISHPDMQQRRIQTVQRLSSQLARWLVFAKRDMTEDQFASSISKAIVEPAMTLHEQFLTQFSDYRLKMDPRFRTDERFSGEMTDLEGIDLYDIADNNRHLILDRLDPKPQVGDIREKLHVVFSLLPALVLTRIDIKGHESEQFITKERLLVAWNPDEKKVAQPRTWIYDILSTTGNTQHQA